MRSLSSFLLFLSIILVLDVGVHGYLYARLLHDTGLPRPVRIVGLVVLVTLAILLPVGLLAPRYLPKPVTLWVANAAYVWMGALFYLVASVVFLDVARALFHTAASLLSLLDARSVPVPDATVDPTRRALLAQGVAGAATVVASGFSAVAIRNGIADVEVREVPVDLERFPKALSGLTIVQLSDIHVGPTLGERFIRQVVERTNELRPDVVAITGDLVDGSVEDLLADVALLGKLKARFGVYFVAGNHEYYSGIAAWSEALTRLGIRVLANESVRVGDTASFDLIGVNDHSASRMTGRWRYDPEQAFRGRQPDRASILLAHQPKSIVDGARLGVDLQLSGHTHGGQFWPFSYLVALTQPYLRGLHRHVAQGDVEGPVSQIYVSCGTGHWGPPMRLNAPAEITKLIISGGA